MSCCVPQAVRLALLDAAVKLFFRRPGEMQALLGRLLDTALADAAFTDVHDRAMLYYRMLQVDVAKASEILQTHVAVHGGSFVGEVPTELLDRIFEEFNTLSVMYGEPSTRFLTHPNVLNSAQAATDADAEPPVNDSAHMHSNDDSMMIPQEQAPEPPPAQPEPSGPMVDLLGLDEPSPPPSAPMSDLGLSPSASLDAPTFQQQWG
jgi:AP-4 complex subunit beta-1